jgi:hypothetical protein
MELGEGNENGGVDSASDERVNRLARHLVLIGVLIAWAAPLAAQDNAQPGATDTPADPADVLTRFSALVLQAGAAFLAVLSAVPRFA